MDISLDSLIPTLKSDKPQQPSMNQLLYSKPQATPYNVPAQQPGAFNMGSPQLMTSTQPTMGQMNYMYQPTNMGMMPNQGSMSPRMSQSQGTMRMTTMGGPPTMMGAQPMGARPMMSSQGFANSNSFTSYKGIS